MTTTDRHPGGAEGVARAGILLAAAVFLTLVLVAGIPSAAHALQFNSTVRGKVTDAAGKPIAGVKVTIRRRAQDPSRPVDPIEMTTDEDGNYFARNVQLGETIIYFEGPGLESHEEARDLRAGPTRIDVTMKAAAAPETFSRAQVANDAYGAGVDAFNAGDYARTVSQMTMALAALEDTPANAEARAYVLALMGAAYLRQRQYDEAIDALTRRLAYAPQNAAAHMELAQALGESGDQAAARPHYEAALALDPDDAVTQYNVGVTMVNAGDVKGGIEHMEKAVELQPVYPLAYKNLGYAYARDEAYAKAVAAFEKYIEQSPDADDVPQVRDFIVALKEMIGE